MRRAQRDGRNTFRAAERSITYSLLSEISDEFEIYHHRAAVSDVISGVEMAYTK
jgi:hypothetical protein